MAFTGTVALGTMTAVAGFAVASLLLDSPTAAGTAVMLAVAILAQQVMLLEQVLLRSRLRFTTAALQLGAAGAAILLAGIIALPWGLTGLMAALVLSLVAALLIGQRVIERRPKLTWDLIEARAIVRIGLPIMLAGLAFSMLTTFDRWIVLAFLGDAAFGIYGLVGIAVSGLLVLSTVVAQQYYPRIAHAYGANRDPAELLAMAQRQSRTAMVVVGVATVPLIAGAWLVLPIVLPAYSAAAAPATFAMLGILAYSGATGSANLLNSVGAQREYLAIQLVAILFDVVAVVALISFGAGIAGAGFGLLVSMLVYAVLLRRRGRAVTRRLTASWATSV